MYGEQNNRSYEDLKKKKKIISQGRIQKEEK